MISNLGNKFELLFYINSKSALSSLAPFNNEWRPYNPRKQGYGREGLSLTSHDGKLSGIPDLDSLREYNSINNTDYAENDFKVKTPVVSANKDIAHLFHAFHKHVSRSHIIKFKKGGYFPPHRDIYIGQKTSVFRLFSLLSPVQPSQYHFVLDGQLQFFVPGTVYYINTMLEHSFVSFSDDLTILVMNIDLNEESIDILQKNLAVK